MASFRSLLTASSVRAYGTSVAAQSTNSSTCPRTIRAIEENDAAFNATKSVRINQPNASPWYFSLALSDRRSESLVQNEQWLDTLISIPDSLAGTDDGEETRICVYRMEGQNATSDSEGSDGTTTCNGILSEECQEAMRDMEANLSGDEDCASVSDDIKEACDGMSFGVYSSTPMNFSSADCAVDNVPHLDLPDNHKTYSVLGGTIGFRDENGDEEDFDGYDLRVQQPVPIMVQMRYPIDNGALTKSLLFCLAPDEVVDGSREPESDFPPNSASHLSYGSPVVYSFLVVMAVALWI